MDWVSLDEFSDVISLTWTFARHRDQGRQRWWPELAVCAHLAAGAACGNLCGGRRRSLVRTVARARARAGGNGQADGSALVAAGTWRRCVPLWPPGLTAGLRQERPVMGARQGTCGCLAGEAKCR